MNASPSPSNVLIDQVVAAANAQFGSELSQDLREAMNAFAGHPDFAAARHAIAQRLIDIRSCTGAGFLAVWFGAAAENGAEPESAGRDILETMLKWSRTVETPPDQDSDEAIEDEEIDPEINCGLEMLGQGLVAHVSRSPALHQQLSDSPLVIEELERIEHLSAGPMWVLELLRKRSGELVVIHVEQRRGYRVSYQNLSNCFHLFTLLQSAMADVKAPDTKRVPPLLKAVALGEQQDDVHDDAWWHYGIGTCPTADFGGSIWGEATLDSIPEIEGEQIVLLWPMLLSSRGWGAGFFGPFLQALPPMVTVVSELTDEEVARWTDRLKLPAIHSKPWWKFW